MRKKIEKFLGLDGRTKLAKKIDCMITMYALMKLHSEDTKVIGHFEVPKKFLKLHNHYFPVPNIATTFQITGK